MRAVAHLSSIVALFAPSCMVAQTDAGVVHVHGTDTCDTLLTQTWMRTLPPHSAIIVAHNGDTATYAGVWLSDVLQNGCGALDKHALVRAAVRIKAADGYSALIALAETDSSFRERPVLLAWMKNGRQLDDHDGPLQIIVPDDRKQARDVRQVIDLEVVAP